MNKFKRTTFILCVALILFAFAGKDSGKPFIERLQPIPKNSGFRMDGYWVWCGSAVKVGSTYHLFAARWPKKNKFPDDYFKESEIVRATSESALGPYTFKEVVIGERDSLYWDSNMAHNPTIHKIGNKFVLFYIGSDFTTKRAGGKALLRRVGYATASNIEGPWIRSEKPAIDEESNNPALLAEPDGSVKLMYRDENLKIKIAIAKDFKDTYRTVNENVWETAKLEDFYLFKMKGKYHFICEDNVGKATGHVRWGAEFISPDGIKDWKAFDPVVVYNHDIPIDDGSVLKCVRRERPQLIIDGNKITHLITGVYDGNNSWSQPEELDPPINLK
jgi:hypothetical protein